MILANEAIQADKVLVVENDNKQVLDLNKAIILAKSRGLDLVQVANTNNQVVCKIVDYEKYVYQMAKKEKDTRKKQKQLSLKEIKMRPKIDVHDYNFKLKNIQEFLTKGHKVKVLVFFRGREIAYLDQGKTILNNIIESCKPLGRCAEGIQRENTNQLSIILTAKKN